MPGSSGKPRPSAGHDRQRATTVGEPRPSGSVRSAVRRTPSLKDRADKRRGSDSEVEPLPSASHDRQRTTTVGEPRPSASHDCRRATTVRECPVGGFSPQHPCSHRDAVLCVVDVWSVRLLTLLTRGPSGSGRSMRFLIRVARHRPPPCWNAFRRMSPNRRKWLPPIRGIGLTHPPRGAQLTTELRNFSY
jgi:hypothetical protein